MSENKNLANARGITKFVVGFGTASAVGTVIQKQMPNEKFLTKLAFGLAAFGLGGAAVMATDAYTDKFFDELNELLDGVSEFRDEI